MPFIQRYMKSEFNDEKYYVQRRTQKHKAEPTAVFNKSKNYLSWELKSASIEIKIRTISIEFEWMALSVLWFSVGRKIYI